MLRWMVLGVVLAACLPAATALAAETGKGEVGIDVGYADLVDKMGGGGPLAAIRGGYHFKPWFEMEAEAGYISPDCPDGECSDLWFVLLNFVFNIHPTPRAVPYAFFGFGYTDFEQEVDSSIVLIEDPFQGQALYQVGAGSRFYFGQKKRTGFRIEVSESFFEDDQSPNAQVGMVWRLGGGS